MLHRLSTSRSYIGKCVSDLQAAGHYFIRKCLLVAVFADNGGAASGLSVRKELFIVTYAFEKKAQKALKTTRRMEVAIPQVSRSFLCHAVLMHFY
jgi:hypothetical protein